MQYKFLDREISIPNMHLGIKDSECISDIHFGQDKASIIALIVANSLSLECPVCGAKFNGRQGDRGETSEAFTHTPITRALEVLTEGVDSELLVHPAHSTDFLVSTMRDILYPDIVSFSYVCPTCREVFVISQMDCYSGWGAQTESQCSWFDVLRDLPLELTDNFVQARIYEAQDPFDEGVKSAISETPRSMCLSFLLPRLEEHFDKDLERINLGAPTNIKLTPATVAELVVLPVTDKSNRNSIPVWARLKTGETVLGRVKLSPPRVTVGGPCLTPEIPKTFPVSQCLANGEEVIQTGQMLASHVARGIAHQLGGIAIHTGEGMRFGESLRRPNRRGRISMTPGSLLNTLAFALDSATMLKRMTRSNVPGKEDWLDMAFITGDKAIRSYIDKDLQHSYLYTHNSFYRSLAEPLVEEYLSHNRTRVNALDSLPVLNSILYTYGPQDTYEEAKKRHEDSSYMFQRALSSLDC